MIRKCCFYSCFHVLFEQDIHKQMLSREHILEKSLHVCHFYLFYFYFFFGGRGLTNLALEFSQKGSSSFLKKC